MDSIPKSQLPVLSVSTYDRVNGVLVACLLVVGALMLTLLVMLLREQMPAIKLPEPITPKPKPGAESALMWVDPASELPPEGGVSLTPSVIAAVDAIVEDLKSGDPDGGIGLGDDGDFMVPSPVREPEPPGASEFDRWRVKFSSADAVDYVELLRHFEIDLGVVHPVGEDIWRLNFSGQGNSLVKSSRTIENEAEANYFVAVGRKTDRWNVELARQAGLNELNGVIFVHFYPENLIDKMHRIENEAISPDRTVNDISSTQFEIKSTSSGYEIEVAEIKY